MKQYRPNLERQMRLFSSMISQRTWRRLHGKAPGAPDAGRIPDNSEPWLRDGVRSVKDALWISDQIKKDMERWGAKQQQAS